jgi:hypothetical protein
VVTDAVEPTAKTLTRPFCMFDLETISWTSTVMYLRILLSSMLCNRQKSYPFLLCYIIFVLFHRR